MPAAIQPIFVVGCPRSGTTLVGNLLAASPLAFNGEESFFLQLMSYWRSMLRPPVASLTENFISRAQVLMRDVIESACRDQGKPFYVDHTPAHALCLDDVWALFARAKVIHVVRHPAAVIESLARSHEVGYTWAGAVEPDRVRLWQQHVSAVTGHEDDSRVRVLRYEDLCRQPVEQTKALLAWSGLPWDEAVLDEFARPHVPDAGKPFALAERTPDGLKFGDQPKMDASPELLTALGPVERLMQRYGYGAGGQLVMNPPRS